jgi:hypothetical protein
VRGFPFLDVVEPIRSLAHSRREFPQLPLCEVYPHKT